MKKTSVAAPRGLAILLALVMALSFTGCKRNEGAKGPSLKSGVTPQSIVDEITTEYTVAMPMALDEQVLTDMMDINIEDVEEYAGTIGMSITTADSFAVVKAKEGKVDEVKAGLEGYLAYVRKSFEQYLPGPYAKASAGKVVTVGDYVFLIILGHDDAELLEERDYEGNVSAVETKIKGYFENI